MDFKESDIREIPVGSILAHSIDIGDRAFKKGRILTEEDLTFLAHRGCGPIMVACLKAEDVHEDPAAARLAASIVGSGLDVTRPLTGRVNLLAQKQGLLRLAPQALSDLNQMHEALTLATLPAWDRVFPQQLVATIKVIPFGVPEASIEAWEERARELAAQIEVAPFVRKRVALIQTRLAGTKSRVLAKTRRVLESRLAALGSCLEREARCSHEIGAVAEELSPLGDMDLVVISGASAITDRRDVIPAGLVQSGGEVHHFGMPVDPGNLLMLGSLHKTPVIGMPGCARSPKLNGFDWILQRVCAGIAVTGREIQAMGVGGLLKEIPSRPLPRSDISSVAEEASLPA